MTYFGPASAPGSLFKKPLPEKVKAVNAPGKQPRERSPAHLAAIRKCPCIACGTDRGEMDAAHLRLSDPSRGKPLVGAALKPDDKWTVPLCHRHHMEQHNLGEALFFANVGVDQFALAEQLWNATPNVEKMRAICFKPPSAGRE